MRCLLVVPSGWAFPNLSSGFNALGWHCERFLLSYSMCRECWSDRGESQHRRNLDLQELAKNSVTRPDLALFVTYDDVLEADTLRVIRRLGIPTVCLHVDMVSQWYRVLRTGPHFDFVWCAQKANIAELRARGIRADYLPMAARDAAVPETAAAEEARYIGAAQPFRVFALRQVAASLPLGIYGFWFSAAEPEPPMPQPLRSRMAKRMHDLEYLGPHLIRQRLSSPVFDFGRSADPAALRACWRGPAAESEFPAIVAAARVNLGFTYMLGRPFTKTELRQCRLREFEIPLLSTHGPYLTQSFPEISELYHVGEEVVTWDTIPELLDKLRQLLRDPGLAKAIADRGRARVRTEHLWQHRVAEVLRVLGIKSYSKSGAAVAHPQS